MQKGASRAKSSVQSVLSAPDKVLDKTRGCGWFALTVGGVRFWMKKLFVAQDYSLLVTDLSHVWTDWRDAVQISHLHEEFNPQLAFSSSDATTKLLNTKLDTGFQHLFTMVPDGDAGVLLELKFAFSSIVTFRWTFRLRTLESQRAAEFIRLSLIEPVITASYELSRQLRKQTVEKCVVLKEYF